MDFAYVLKGQNDASRGIHSPGFDEKYHHVTFVPWGNSAFHPGDKSPGYIRTPVTGLNDSDAKTKPDDTVNKLKKVYRNPDFRPRMLVHGGT